MDPTLQYGMQGAGLGAMVGGPWGAAIGGGAGAVLGGAMDLFGGGGPTPEQKAQAAYAAQAAQNYQRNQGQIQAQLGQLRQLQNGQRSLSMEQLRQSLQQNLAAQQSMAAGAAPQNAVMAARQASIEAGRLGSGLAGQQAMAGIAERNQATMAMNSLLSNNGMLNNNAAMGGWGLQQAGQQNQYQQNLDSQNQTAGMLAGAGALYAMGRGNKKPEGDGKVEAGGSAGGYSGMSLGVKPLDSLPSLSSLIGGGNAVSDRRLKTNIKDGSAAATKLLDGLSAHLYDYKDPRHGKGKQLGLMAQDIEKAGLKSAVIDTPAGKVVHGAKLALGIAATLPGLHKRIRELEAKR